MVEHPSYQPFYTNSHALIIGINKYQSVGPLAYARNDAEAVADLLRSRYEFPSSNVHVLLDHEATREAISRAFLRLASRSHVERDDRIFVFFAGHGHTVTGRFGETGFLVPFDGQVDDLSTLIRWDELTRNADLISAKHILFLMDACYGGLALTRKVIQPGSMRFLKDMLRRYARQVLTAGKADEVVADGGGGRVGHSIFTSHVLDVLDGTVTLPSEVLSATSLMHYVHAKVGSDPHSQQTPHYGFLDGDGDFILDTSPLAGMDSDPKEENDTLVHIPPTMNLQGTAPEESVAVTMKRLIADPKDKIRLDDFVAFRLRNAIDALSLKCFPVQPPEAMNCTAQELEARLGRYEEAIIDLHSIVMILARWADSEQLGLLQRIFSRLGETEKGQAGLNVWIELGWYPILSLLYSAGISALSAHRYDTLAACMQAPVYTGPRHKRDPIVVPTISALTDIVDVFKLLPGYERNYVSRSEYFFKHFQPMLEDQLLLGRSYEPLFDQFEVLLALIFADLTAGTPIDHVWGPPGRFGWKHPRGQPSPYNQIVNEARLAGTNWEPIRVGLFQSSPQRFEEIAVTYGERLSRLNWW